MIETSKIVLYLVYSLLIGLLAYFIAKSLKGKQIASKNHSERSLAIQEFFMQYPWVISVIAFIVFLVIDLSRN